MIIRKPYAFLIKNFKKIHIFLFVLCAYVYYKNMQTSSFIKEFLNLGTYDAYNEPISKYIPIFVLFCLFIMIATSITLIILLKHKQKPWKLYLLPVVEYTAMFITFMTIRSFFQSFSGTYESATIRALRDIVFILTMGEFPVFVILFIRVFGVDLHKFNFKSDAEYLELESKDQEELEINIDIDKESVKRAWKRLLRNSNYVYQEHKRLINTIALILVIIVMKNTYTYIFVTNKSYNQGESFAANGYTITIHNAYYTDKNYTGKVISSKSSFVILDLSIKNNLSQRTLDLNKYHIMNGTSNNTTTFQTYGTDFQDLGKTAKNQELKKEETLNLIMVFKVDKKLNKDRFVLYYQEFQNGRAHLRKIKLKIEDLSEIKEEPTKKLGEKFNFTVEKQEETISFDNIDFIDNLEYSYRICNSTKCGTYQENYTAKPGEKILKIDFASINYEGKDMIDFSTKYGKIEYIDSNNSAKTISIKNPLQKTYYGKYLYISVPQEVSESSEIEIVYTVRNHRYTYKLR